MALTSWKGSVVRKQDIFTAKNYLLQDEIDTLNRLTVLFLDTAELRVKERKDLHLRYWRETVDGLLNFQNKAVLQGVGSVSVQQMEAHIESVYEQFHAKRKALAAAEADQQDQKEVVAEIDLFDLQETLQKRK